MRLGGFLSTALHIGAVIAFTPLVMGEWRSEPAPMMILPVELLDISDTTNVAPTVEESKTDEIADEAKPEDLVAAAAAPPPPPEPEEEVLPTEEPPPKKAPEPKKVEPKPEAKKEKEQDFQSALQGLMKAAESAPAPAPKRITPGGQTAAEARKGVGDKNRMTMTVADAIRSQLLSKGCWTNQADMADAPRLRAVIAVKFGRDGHFSMEPRLIEPNREPAGDQPLQVYIQRARRALNKCNQMGFQIPEQYFEFNPVQTIEIEFLPGQ
jgi:outer membrane biosynthesis protein TonB